MVGSDKQGPDGPAAEVSDQHPAVAEVSDGQPAMPEVSDSAVPEVSDSAVPEVSDSAVPDLSDRQPPDAAGHDMYDEVDVEYDQADVEMQAQEGPKPGMEDLLLAPKRKLYSVSLTMFFVILLWDVLGTPRPNANPVRSFYEWKPQQPISVSTSIKVRYLISCGIINI